MDALLSGYLFIACVFMFVLNGGDERPDSLFEAVGMALSIVVCGLLWPLTLWLYRGKE